MFDKISPYALIDEPNPVFQQDQRHLPFLKTSDEFRQFNRLVWLILPAAILLWWLLERISYGFGVLPADLENRLILLVLYLSLGLMPLSSMYTLVTVIGPLNRLFHLGQWQLLRITTQSEAEILKAKDAILQIRVWKFFALEMGLRITIVALFFLNILYIRYHAVSTTSFVFFTLLNPLCWGVYTFVFFMGFVYILEPILRMKIIVALCAVAAIRVRHPSFALLAGMMVILLIHLVQAGLAVIGFYLYRIFIGQGNDNNLLLIALCFLPLSILVSIAGYMIYWKMRKITLGFVYKIAISEEMFYFHPSKVAQFLANWPATLKLVKKNGY